MTFMCTHKIALLSLLIFFTFISTAYSPADEIPTTTDTWVAIDEAHFSIEREEDIAIIVIQITGRASPLTHHCGIAFVKTYKNGTTDYNGIFSEGPIVIDQPDNTLYFRPENGSWEHWTFVSIARKNSNDIGIKKSELSIIASFNVWVRAYRDEAGTYWNQTYITLTQNVTKELEEFYGEETDNPALLYAGIVIIVVSIIAMVTAITRGKGRTKKR